MRADHRFQSLLEKYLANQASAAEYEELMRLIKTGGWDVSIKQQIEQAFDQDRTGTPMDTDRAQELLYKILSSEKYTAQLIPVVGKRKIRTLWILGAAAAIVLLLAGWWLWQQPFSHQSINELELVQGSGAQSLLKTSTGTFTRLPDGSTVLLNKKSVLKYPSAFTGHSREVFLTGEGFFVIKHNPAQPFIVHTGQIRTTVLGTAFNIKALPGHQEITVTVTKGKVQVGNEQQTFGVLLPNDQLALNLLTEKNKLIHVNADDVLQWKQQYLVLDNLSLEEAAVLISKKYHVNIVIADENLKSTRLSATFFNNENLEQVLTVITSVMNATYTMQRENQVTIQ